MAQAEAKVWPENLDAWRIFQRLASRLVKEFALGPEVFRRMTEELDAEGVAETVERVAVIYDILIPVPKE